MDSYVGEECFNSVSIHLTESVLKVAAGSGIRAYHVFQPARSRASFKRLSCWEFRFECAPLPRVLPTDMTADDRNVSEASDPPLRREGVRFELRFGRSLFQQPCIRLRSPALFGKQGSLLDSGDPSPVVLRSEKLPARTFAMGPRKTRPLKVFICFSFWFGIAASL